MNADCDLQESLRTKYNENVSSSATSNHICFCNRDVSIHYHDSAISELFQASIRHLEMSSPPGSPDLEIFCFATDDSPRRWLQENELSIAINQTMSHSSFRYCFQGHSLFAFDSLTKRAFYWVDTLSAFDFYRARPFTRILSWYAEHRHLTWVHAACVGISSGAVLIPAAGGSGKSTSAAACLLSALLFVGDDFVVLDKERLDVSSVYSNMMLSAKSIDLLRGFERVEILQSNFRDKKEKDCYQLFEDFQQQLEIRLPLRGILVPEIVAGESRVVPAKKDEAMRAFVSTLQIGRILGLAPNPMLKDLHSIVQQLPTCKLEIGGDLGDIPQLISQFLNRD